MRQGKPGERMRWHAVVDRCPDARAGAEIGVLRGAMSAELLSRIPTLTLYMVDRWLAYPPSEYRGHVSLPRKSQDYFDAARDKAERVARRYSDRAVIVREDSLTAAQHVPGDLDFVFIDADHRYEAVLADIAAWRPHVRPGGWLMGHDYNREAHPGVVQAVDECFAGRIETDKNRVWAVQL